jgi:hypothetical protein
MDDKDNNSKQEIFSESVRAGRRTYFFDVKETRRGDMYLTITESKKVFDKEGNFHFEKHKLFLYKEDFEKFIDAYNNAVGYIENNVEDSLRENSNEDSSERAAQVETEKEEKSDFTDVDFDDLEKDDE